MAYNGVYVFGDSLVDAGNALKLAEFYGDLTFSDLPDGAPDPELGYFLGRFSNGYSFADLLANKTIGVVTKPIFPYGYEDPWIGAPIAPWASDPNGNNLNFAYGGAQIRQGGEVVPDLDGQTDAFRDAVDGRADPNALYLITIGGNDVRNLAPTGSDPVPRDQAYAALDASAQKMLHELSQLVAIGVKNILITGIPDVGLVARYDRDGNNLLDATEQMRADAATEYSQYLDMLIRTVVVPALEGQGAVVTYVPIMDYVDEVTGQAVTGALNANMQTLAFLNGIQPNEPGETAAQELAQNLLTYENVVFFDGLHPNAQAHALLGSFMHAQLNNLPWIENMPLLGADVDYAAAATIGAAGEVDKVSVAMVAGTTYTFQMLGVSSLTSYTLGQLGIATLPSGPLLGDPTLKLLSPSGVVLRADDDSGAGFDSSLAHAATAAGVYSLQLSAVGGLTGIYVLTATVSGAAMEAGNSYTVSSGSTLVLEGAGGIGVDSVSTSVSYALARGSEIEVLQTTNPKGKGTINLTGNEFGQKIVGNAAANVLEGKGGADEFVGGAGNDRFVLSKTAVDIQDGSQVDKISDYATGDVVDITQILSVASGTNVVNGGYVRVTTSGFIQVDLDGGGNGWVTLSTINGTGAVSIRYLSGGSATTVSVSRVDEQKTATASSTNTITLGAVAAAGLMAEPVAAENYGRDPALSTLRLEPIEHTGLDSSALHPDSVPRTEIHSELSGLAGHGIATSSAHMVSREPVGDGTIAAASAAPSAVGAPVELLGGTTTPIAAADAAWPVAQAVAMRLPEMLQAIGQFGSSIEAGSGADATAEVARVLVDALAGGQASGPNLDTLLDAVAGQADSTLGLAQVASHAGWADGFAVAHQTFSMEGFVFHQDALPQA